MPITTALVPTPAAGKGIPYTWFTTLLANDVALASGQFGQVDITTTGTVNDHAPGVGMVIRCNNATALTINGLVPIGNGEIRIYENVGTSTVQLKHQNAGAVAANRFLLPSTAGQWIGPGGAAGIQYDATTTRWRLIFVQPGTPIDVAYAAGNFTAGGGATWTLPGGAANQTTFAFVQSGALVDLSVCIVNSTIAVAPATTLILALPGGFTQGPRQQLPSLIDMRVNGVQLSGIALAAVSSGVLNFYKQDRTNFAIGAANNDVNVTVRLFVT